MNEELLQSLPEEFAELADSRRVMREVSSELVELHETAIRLGDALEAAGLPGREWRSRDASLRLISRKLPDITVDRFITRLSEFAAGHGPDWLHGDDSDLDRFQREVQAIYRAAARLGDILEHRQHTPERPRQEWAIERAFGDPRVMSALNDAVEILDDFRALQPFMAPLTRDEWKSLGAVPPLETVSKSNAETRAQHDTLPLPANQAHARLRDFARATMGPRSRRDRPKDPVEALIRGAQSLMAPLLRRKPVVIALAFTVVLVVATGLAVLALHHQASAGAVTNGHPSTGPIPTLASTPAATAPVAHPTATAAPAPRLVLTCKVNSQGSSATLSIKNSGVTSLTWQVSANRELTVTPSHGALSIGQSATAQVTTNSRRGLTNSTVTVAASSSGRSASFGATCG